MPERDKKNRKALHNGIILLSHAGDRFEERISSHLSGSRFEAPVLTADETPEPKKWYRVPLPLGLSGDGSEYHIYLKAGTTDKLVIFLSGGGVAWNEYTAARPATSGAVVSWQPNFYWNNLRPFTQLMNINVGITETDSARNPFDDWNFVVVTYSTGDLHVGNSTLEYKLPKEKTEKDAGTGKASRSAEPEPGSGEQDSGRRRILHFHGHTNFTEAMKVAIRRFPNPSKLLIAGNSAGAFAVPALSGEIAEAWYPDCEDITLLSDSGQLLYSKWKHIVRETWNADPAFADPVHSDNITLDWFRSLCAKHGRRFRYLYASSTHDYLLSAYYNDVTKKTYRTDSDVQEAFYGQLVSMCAELREFCPDIHFFINNWKNVLYTKGGTVHTAVREPYFYIRMNGGPTMAGWLADAVEGRLYDVGTELLKPPDSL
ncbi:MAG: pectin acetylesterase [Lachnospiraceae bacterium]|nr:pectin acetylesterase [Lachnospiraceae bacterium]